MGIKFIKMDPESRSVVERIAEDRGHPGVFEQGKDGVRVTPALASDAAELEEAELAKVPMARWGTPEDLAPMFLFLASPAAAFITGQTFNVDGGYSLT